jgi:hypothetical protein
MPGAVILSGQFAAVQQAVGTAKAKVGAAAWLRAFAEEVKASGLVGSVYRAVQCAGAVSSAAGMKIGFDLGRSGDFVVGDGRRLSEQSWTVDQTAWAAARWSEMVPRAAMLACAATRASARLRPAAMRAARWRCS